MRSSNLPAFLVLLLSAGGAWAHPGHASYGFEGGALHPLLGWDHLLAMLAVGFYAKRQPGVARWALPAGFLLTMMAGAVLGAMGFVLPGLETGIATSVGVLGLMIALAWRPPIGAVLPLIGVFALCHGGAHGSEMAAGMAAQDIAGYFLGFMGATGMLHGLGALVAMAIPRDGFARAVGGAIALSGVALLAV